jgi:transcription termination/antitermination protein NusG
MDSAERKEYAWYALKVRSRAEATASAALRSRGYDPYYPTRAQQRRYSDRVKRVEEAILPGYLFCKFDPQKKVGILSSAAVEYIVGVGGVPAPIPDQEIANVRRAVEAGGIASPYIRKGEQVLVTSGVLAGVQGILARDDGGDRLVVSIELLNRSVSVEINRQDVRPVLRTYN